MRFPAFQFSNIFRGSMVYLLEPDIDLKKEAVVMDVGYILFYSAVCNDVFGWS